MLIETAIELPLCANLRSLSLDLTAGRVSGLFAWTRFAALPRRSRGHGLDSGA
jgi:hypothetical protein